MIRVACPYCKSSGYIAPPPPQTILMGPCPICAEPVALYNGKVIGLKKKLLGEGVSGEKIQSLARVIMEYINSQAGHVDEKGIERFIQGVEDHAVEEAGGEESASDIEVSPSIRNPIASPITNEEIEDFLRIDLPLLGKKKYFDRHFG